MHRGERATIEQAEQALLYVAVLVPGLLEPLAACLRIKWLDTSLEAGAVTVAARLTLVG